MLEGAPQPCSARGQHAPAVHQAVLADGQARCQRRPRREHRRDVLPPLAGALDRVGSPRRQTGRPAGQRKGGHDVHDRLQHEPRRFGHVGADRTRGQDRRRLASASLARAHSPRHIGERLGHDDHDPAAASLDDVMNPSKEGQSWILLWDMASIHASEATLAAMRAAFPHVVLCFLPPRSTSYLQPCDVAVFRSFKSCIQTQASATLARSVLDGTFEGLAMNEAWRRQSSAEWAARAVTDLCDENKAWTTGWRPLRAHSDTHFKEAASVCVLSFRSCVIPDATTCQHVALHTWSKAIPASLFPLRLQKLMSNVTQNST